MGNDQSSSSHRYKIIKKQVHPLLGQVNTIEAASNNDTSILTMKSKLFADIQEFKKTKEKMQKRYQMPDLNGVIHVAHIEEKNTEKLCHTLWQLNIFYNSIGQSLQDDFLERRYNNRPFTQKEIMTLISNGCSGILSAEQNELRLYHISKRSMMKTQSEYALLLQEDSEKSSPILQYLGDFNADVLNKNSYLSPQILQAISHQQPYFQKKSCDYIFTFGVIILSLCLLKQIPFESQIVLVQMKQNSKKLIFHKHLVQTQLRKLKKLVNQIQYSSTLKKLICSMIQYELQKRINIFDLISTIKKLEYTIAVDESMTKKTEKIINWEKQVKNPTQTIKLYPPSLQNLQTSRTHCRNPFKQNINSDPKKGTIAMQGYDYKRTKVSCKKIDNYCNRQVTSQLIPQMRELATPIKQLQDDQQQINMASPGLLKGITNFIYTHSTYRADSQQIFSRTSLACNIEKFG